MTEPKWGQSIVDMELEAKLQENKRLSESIDRELQRIIDKWSPEKIDEYVWNELPWYLKIFFPGDIYKYWKKKK